MKLSSRTAVPIFLLSLAMAAAAACSDAEPGVDDDGGSGGKGTGGKTFGAGGKDGVGAMGGEGGETNGAATGGKGTGGKGSGGRTGDGGKPSDGDGGKSSGGSPSTGGEASGGSESGGSTGSGATSGTGGTLADCGDGNLSGSEQCDDDGTVEDGCSESCTLEACDDCRASTCADYGKYLTCDGAPEAIAGDCLEVLSCVRESGCALSNSIECYCGDSPAEDCFTPFSAEQATANGPCRDLIIAVSGSAVPIEIGQYYFDPDTAVGFVMQTVTCEQTYCGQECEYDDYVGTGGSSGGGGTSGGGGSSGGGASGGGGTSGGGGSSGGGASGGGSGGDGTGGSGGDGSGGSDPGGGCDVSCPECSECAASQCSAENAATWGFPTGACVTMPACQTYRSCVDESGCAEGTSDPEAELVACYCGDVPEETCFASTDSSLPTGACKGSVEELAGSMDPSVVGAQFFTGGGPLAALNELFLCQKVECESECSSYFGTP